MSSRSRLDIAGLDAPVVQAPMAGGVSTPALAAAVSEAGGLGFLAAGYLSADAVREQIVSTRVLTDAPFGVNVFVPGPPTADHELVEAYAHSLEAEAARLGVDVGTPHPDHDDWHAKIALLAETSPAVATFTFGAPSQAVVARLQEADVAVGITVTSLAELVVAKASKPDFVVAQGPLAGGHRGTFDAVALPSEQPLYALLAELSSNTRLPIVVAGGLASSEDVEGVLAAGAAAAAAGTAFLRADEAGTASAHRQALVSGEFAHTALTKAFSGRWARGLVNDFMREHEADAPFGYPDVHQVTSPIRRAAAAADDPQRMALWAGVHHARALAAPAATILSTLVP
jgi:nitronate monooxygenase